MATAFTDDLNGVLKSLLGLYGTDRPDPARALIVEATPARPGAFAGALETGYSGASGMQLSVADTHANRDGLVVQTVSTSGGATVAGRNRLTDQIADLQSRIQAISSVRDTRFSVPALLDAAQIAIVKATDQVDTDTVVNRKLAAQIMPAATPQPVKGRRNTRSRQTRVRRTRQIPRFRSDGTLGSKAVSAASGWLGTPYVWGGGGAGGPSRGGFDCSGLTQYAVARASGGHVVLPRTTYEQMHAGVRVPVSEVRPGDLVFPAGSFSTRGPEHVQLAAGKGMVIEAPHSGSTVQWSRMSSDAVVVRVL